MMLGDEDKGYNAGYSFHGRMFALAQVEGMMAVVEDELKRGITLWNRQQKMMIFRCKSVQKR